MAQTCILRAFGCRCHGVFLWCYVCFLLLRFRLYAFVEAAVLRSIVLRYAGVPIATRVSFFVFFFFSFVYLEISLFPIMVFFLYHFRFLFVWTIEYHYRRTFFPSGWCFFYLVTTGWIFDISLCEISINRSIKKCKIYIYIYAGRETQERIPT